jgi:hypothetical protein
MGWRYYYRTIGPTPQLLMSFRSPVELLRSVKVRRKASVTWTAQLHEEWRQALEEVEEIIRHLGE